MRAGIITLILFSGVAPGALAAEVETAEPFTLGQIIVIAPDQAGVAIASSTLSSEAIYTFNRGTLDEAVSLMPGVSASNSGGSRNERLIFVRGFDRFQVPLSIDGIRVYLPADNRLDYGRFLTPDIAEVQVAKGYASVLDGPGAMGGAVNLVTRQPTKAIEAEVRGTLSLDRDIDYAGFNVFALLGTKQDNWYAQGSYARNFQDHWDLPGGFTPTASEDGGARDFSRTRDWRVNVKLGITPNETDEYSISYTRQEGSKNAPLHVSDTVATQRNWTWPYWNIESIYFLSSTALGDRATLKTRVYRNTFDNLLAAYDDVTQTTQTRPRAFNSYYEDEAWGGSAELGVDLTDTNRLSVAAHYRRDRHVEFQQSFPAGTTEPDQVNLEETWSVAAENRLRLSPALTFIAGASIDWRDLKRAEEYGSVPGLPGNRLFSYPIRNSSALSGQGQIVWTPDAATRIHASVSSRARFPSIFERFSARFGGATSNPGLKAERAVNYEIGGSRQYGAVRVEGAAFYSRLSNVIVAFPTIIEVCTAPGVCDPQAVTQSRNLGKGENYGVELAVDARLGDTLGLGANYTWTHRDLDDPANAAFQPTGVPEHKAFVWADWSPVSRLHVVPNVDIASSRWTVNTAGTRYSKTGSYVLANLRIDLDVTETVTIGMGARNLFDEAYQLTDGFPEPGRSVFASVRARL
ncbi:TonB-dependent receptor plug domain-containing protein [Sphingosinicella microcystinivorans]|uniref:Iron complex outermembrane receptor protein n=1 Tax=Sphingosinicella microcystinivorans TaxID=335406 RepID=A0AAD1D4K2_SPHMI|nr:TonB-dependent receptor [Sphingosinicella microcystinivorans]RKS90750.1 iron complex outermembrane receptor protein [Sphingosinicella microcystinivorans]BBE33665.1 TonB-dependent receptor [Sphingosinicella microcystinivorans]